MNDATLTELIGKGEYDLFEWGWTPFVDPDPELSYFTCDQLSKDVEDPTNYYNDANWCDPTYDADYKAQNDELDHEKRVEIVHRMLRTMYDAAIYNVLLYEPRPAGVPHRPLRGLAAPACRDRPGALLEHVADVREPDARASPPAVAAGVSAERGSERSPSWGPSGSVS